MEGHSLNEEQTEPEASSACGKNGSDAEVSFLGSITSLNDVNGNISSPGTRANQQMNEEESGLQGSKSPSNQNAEAEVFEPVPIKEETEDYSEGSETQNEEAGFEQYPIKNEQDVKSESDSYTTGSSSDDEGFPWDNLVTLGTR